jgi:hypothetical protein
MGVSIRVVEMKFPALSSLRRSLLRRDTSKEALQQRSDQMEKLLAESLRMMGQLFGKLADVVEQQRLNRAGYEEQEKFLERLDEKKKQQ